MRNIIIYIFFLFTVFYSTGIYAQTIIQGHIIDEKGAGISYISVVLRQLPDSTISTYEFSDENGRYELIYEGLASNLLISVSGLNIVPQAKVIDNRNQTINFKMTEEIVELREVIIKSTKIWGNKDTINYLVSSFSDENDLVIGDVLKKMPGIDVEESGQIRYQGKPINKFYIENMDMLQGRYGIATNNISAKDVSTIQILENHQPIKALDNVRISNNAAINLKLKEGAKGAFSIMVQLGMGFSPMLWENELTGMYFAKKKQNITTFKNNNSGVDLYKELRSFTTRYDFGNENLLAVNMPSPPSIDLNRYLFNNSNTLTINNLIKTKESSEMNFNVIYFNDHENRESKARTSYYLPGQDMLIIDENMASARNIDRLETEFRYNKNDVKSYLNNYLNAEGEWERNQGSLQSEKEISQQLVKPTFRINNSFHWVKKSNTEKGLEFYSNAGFKTTPQTLSIQPGLYNEIFNDGKDYTMLRQKAQINSFYLNNKITILSPFLFGNIRIDPSIELNMESRNLHSDIYTQTSDKTFTAILADSMRNNINWIKYTAGVGINVRYNILRNLHTELSLPVYYHGIHLNNKIETSKNDISRLFFQPSLILSYDLSSQVKLEGGYRNYNQLGNLQTLYTGYILQNYRNLNHYEENILEAKGNGGNLGISYKNLINMFFAGAEINYNHLKKNLQFGQNFQDILSITSAIEQTNSQESMTVNGRISKGFDWKNAVIGIEVNYGKFRLDQLRQSQLVDYEINSQTITGTVSGKPTTFLLFTYKGVWGRNTSKTSGDKVTPTIRSYVNQACLNIKLPKNIAVYVNSEYYYNSASLGNKSLSFIDLGISYICKKVDWRLSWNNIFDTDNYVSAYYGDMNTYQQIYHIRPANVMLKVRFKLI